MRSVNPNQPQMARLDPSASRLKYRMERLMLTPLVRGGLRVLPYAAVLGAAGAWLSFADNRALLGSYYEAGRDIVAERPEFQVNLMAVDGGSALVSDAVRQVLPVDFPISSMDLDLEDMKTRVLELEPVKSAELRIKQNVLHVTVTERSPSVLWRQETGALVMLDHEGALVGPAQARAQHVTLPVIAGEGAKDAVTEALELFAVIGPLAARLRGFERMGDRRWDVVLDRDQRIMLPETGAVRALERTIAMDQAVDMLSRDLLAVDLRLPRRPTLRMSELATQDMWRVKSIEAGGVQNQ